MKPLKPPVCPCCGEPMNLLANDLVERSGPKFILKLIWACKKITHRVEINKQYRIEVEEL